MSLGSVKLKIDVKMTKVQKAVKSKKSMDLYLSWKDILSFFLKDSRIDGEQVIWLERELKRFGPWLKDKTKQSKQTGKKQKIFVLQNEGGTEHASLVCCGRGIGYFS